MVVHLSTNQAQCRLTLLIEANTLTTMLHYQLLSGFPVHAVYSVPYCISYV